MALAELAHMRTTGCGNAHTGCGSAHTRARARAQKARAVATATTGTGDAIRPGMTTLKDISGSIDPRYGTGTTKVWYQKPSFFRDGHMGHAWLVEHNLVPTAASLTETHACVGAVDTDEPEVVFMMMQGESWSPRGEARGLIMGLGLEHTSMSVGDIVQVDDALFLVDGCGFARVS